MGFRKYTGSEKIEIEEGTRLEKITSHLKRLGKTSAATLSDEETEELEGDLDDAPRL